MLLQGQGRSDDSHRHHQCLLGNWSGAMTSTEVDVISGRSNSTNKRGSPPPPQPRTTAPAAIASRSASRTACSLLTARYSASTGCSSVSTGRKRAIEPEASRAEDRQCLRGSHDGWGRDPDDRNALPVPQALGGDGFGGIGLDDADQVWHDRHHHSGLDGDQIFVLELNFQLFVSDAGDPHRTPSEPLIGSPVDIDHLAVKENSPVSVERVGETVDKRCTGSTRCSRESLMDRPMVMANDRVRGIAVRFTSAPVIEYLRDVRHPTEPRRHPAGEALQSAVVTSGVEDRHLVVLVRHGERTRRNPVHREGFHLELRKGSPHPVGVDNRQGRAVRPPATESSN